MNDKTFSSEKADKRFEDPSRQESIYTCCHAYSENFGKASPTRSCQDPCNGYRVELDSGNVGPGGYRVVSRLGETDDFEDSEISEHEEEDTVDEDEAVYTDSDIEYIDKDEERRIQLSLLANVPDDDQREELRKWFGLT